MDSQYYQNQLETYQSTDAKLKNIYHRLEQNMNTKQPFTMDQQLQHKKFVKAITSTQDKKNLIHKIGKLLQLRKRVSDDQKINARPPTPTKVICDGHLCIDFRR